MVNPRNNQAMKWQMQFFVRKHGVTYVRGERRLGPHVICRIVGSELTSATHH